MSRGKEKKERTKYGSRTYCYWFNCDGCVRLACSCSLKNFLKTFKNPLDKSNKIWYNIYTEVKKERYLKMRTDYTVKELFEKAVEPKEIDIIILHKGNVVCQCDNPESLEDFYEDTVTDYEIEYDTDEGLVYLDIYCE